MPREMLINKNKVRIRNSIKIKRDMGWSTVKWAHPKNHSNKLSEKLLINMKPCSNYQPSRL